MRILLVSSSSGSRGGGEIFLLYLAKALLAAGHEPLLWCASHRRMDELAEQFKAIGQVYREPYKNSYLDRRLRLFSAAFDERTIRKLAGRFACIPCDLIHLNKQTLEDGLDLVEAIRRSRKPIVSTVHITQSNQSLGAVAGGLRDALALHRLNRAKEFTWTAVSDARAEELRQRLNGAVHTIYNAVSECPAVERKSIREEILAPRVWNEDCILVVCVARLVAQKDPARFLRLANALYRRDSSFRFLWIGDGDERKSFNETAASLGLADVVDCTGWSHEPRRYLGGADLYLHPAAYEGLPLAILEAMAASLPCVLSPAIAAEVDVFDGSNVILVKDHDDSWVDAATSKERREDYAAASRELYETHFRPESMAARFIDLYRSKLV
jgi:glycosyltransferase involved in cell wall biosynthesis